MVEVSILKVVPTGSASTSPSLKLKLPSIKGWLIFPLIRNAPTISPPRRIIPGGVKAPATRSGNFGIPIFKSMF